MDYVWSQLKLDQIRVADTVSEKDSEKSIQQNTNDIFVEINEKINAVFNITGFAIYIKISGMILVKNYIHNRMNLRLQLNDQFIVTEEQKFGGGGASLGFGYGSSSVRMKNGFKCLYRLHTEGTAYRYAKCRSQ